MPKKIMLYDPKTNTYISLFSYLYGISDKDIERLKEIKKEIIKIKS